MNKFQLFLGGTCNSTNWREELIPLLDHRIEYFNPVVDDWTENRYTMELMCRKHADCVLYVITPQMKGIYSIAEVVDDANKRPAKTVLCVLYENAGMSFDEDQRKSLQALEKMVALNGAIVIGEPEASPEDKLKMTAEFMNMCCLLKLSYTRKWSDLRLELNGVK